MEKQRSKTKEKKSRPNKGAPFTSYQIFIVAIMALLQFTVVLDFMILAPLGDMLMKNLGMTTKQFGTVVSAYAISAGVSGILAAGFADKFDRKKLLLFFYIGFTVGTLFCGLANSYQTLFYARMITGVFGGVIAAISMAIITDLFSLNQRGRVMGFVQMSFAASQILGLPLGLELATRWGWHSTFFMIVGVAVLMGITLAWKLKPITEHLKTKSDKNAIQHLWNTIQKRDYRIGFLATAMLSLGGFMIMPFTSAFLVNNVGIPQRNLSIIYFCTGLASIIIMPIVGKLSDRIDKFKLFTIGTLVACCMVLLYTNLSVTPIWVVIIINMILFMGLMSRLVPATALNSAIPATYDRGAFMSINSSLQQMSGGVAAIIAGLIVYQPTKTSPIENFDEIGYIMAATFFLCIYLMYRVNKMINKRPVEEDIPAVDVQLEI